MNICHTFAKKTATFLLLITIFSGLPLNAADKKYSITKKTYKTLALSRELMDQSSYQNALAKLNTLLTKVTGNRYETALVHQHLAYVYLEQENYIKALHALEKTLTYADTLPVDTVQSVRYNLAQTATRAERFKIAEKSLNQWFVEAAKPPADAWYLRGLVHYKQQQLKPAATYLKRAIALSHHENWSILLLTIYLDLKQYTQATKILTQLIEYYPHKKEYWLNLTDVYLMRQDYPHALSTLQLAQLSIDLNEQEILKLASLYLHNNTPYNAATLLTTAIKKQRIKNTAQNLETLANSWAMAREPEKELNSLKQAIRIKPSGKLYLRSAQILLHKERWQEAILMLNRALKNKVKNPGQVYLLKGIAAYQDKKMQTAKAAFIQATKYNKSKKQANNWLQQLNQQQ